MEEGIVLNLTDDGHQIEMGFVEMGVKGDKRLQNIFLMGIRFSLPYFYWVCGRGR